MRTSDALLIAQARQALDDGSAREIRENARLTCGEVGEVCGVTDDAVRLWESRKRTPRGEPARRYARLLHELRQTKASA